MPAQSRVVDLILHWQDLREQGQTPTPEQICADTPELLDEFKRRIGDLASLVSLLSTSRGVSAANPVGASTATTVTGPTSGRHPTEAPIGPVGYESLGILGDGGMGVVYKARQLGLNRIVALKMIKAGSGATPHDIARFRTEAEAVARLQHPNIIQIHAIGEHQGLPYFSLEYCPGGSLAKQLNGTPLPPTEAARLVETLARAMHVAHEHGILHRDLKPANVLLQISDFKLQIESEEGAEAEVTHQSAICNLQSAIPKIADFGLAKKLDDDTGHTQTGVVMGTPSYMAPEQAVAQSHAIGPTTDVYALGAILYELLTGRPPFKAATAWDTVHQVIYDEPVAPRQLQPKTQRDLETICLKCLRKEGGKRYCSALELAEDLRRWQAGDVIIARPVGRIERCWRWCRQRPAQAGLVAASALFLVAAAGAMLWFIQDRASLALDEALRRSEAERQELMREQKRSEEQHRTELAVRGTVRQANDLTKKGLWREAETTLKHQQELLGAEGDARLREDVDTALINLKKAEILERIRSDKLLISADGRMNNLSAAGAYARAFAEQGFAVDVEDNAAIAAKLASSPLRSAYLDALDDWLTNERNAQRRASLCLITARLTSQPWRVDLSDAVAAGPKETLTAFLNRVPVAEMTTSLFGGLCFQLEERGGDGLAFLESACLQHPSDVWLQYARGTIALTRGPRHLDQAAGAFAAGLALRPDSGPLKNGLAAALRRKGDWKHAVALAREAVRLEPGVAMFQSNLGAILHAVGDMPGAVAACKDALRVDPNHADAYTNLAAALRETGDLDGCMAAAKQALALNSADAKAHCNIGIVMHTRGELRLAIAAYKEAIRLNSGFTEVYNNLGNAYRDLDEFPRAIDTIRKAIALDPNNPYAHASLGAVLREFGLFSDAVASSQIALNILPVNHPLHKDVQRDLRVGNRLVALEKRLTTVLEGTEPVAIADLVQLALAYELHREKAATAARLFELAFQKQPALAQDMDKQHRYRAACAAAQAATPPAQASQNAGADANLKHRRQALDWLRADLRTHADHLKRGSVAITLAIERRLMTWQRDPKLAVVRDVDALTHLPEGERDAWQDLWKEVAGVLKKAQTSFSTTLSEGSLTAGNPSRIHVLKLSASRTYVFDLESTAFDAWLKLADDSGKLLAENNDVAPDSSNSRIIFTAPADGAYRISATSFEQGAGPYTLRIREFGER
jgi:serine/threonine-protein kinase